MSSNKPYIVECDLILRYELQINAQDEDAAIEKARDRLELIAETQKYPPHSHETEVERVGENYGTVTARRFDRSY